MSNAVLEASDRSLCLIPGLPDEVVVGHIWPLLAADLYILHECTPLQQIRTIVYAFYGLRSQSRSWRRLIDSSLEGLVLKSTFHFAKMHCGFGEEWEAFLLRKFYGFADLLSQQWWLQSPLDPTLFENIIDFSHQELERVVLILRKARRSTRHCLFEFHDEIQAVWVPPVAHCSLELLRPRIGAFRAYLGFCACALQLQSPYT